MQNIWIVLPVKQLSQTKSRLMQVLSPAERAELTRHLAERTLDVLQHVPEVQRTIVVSRDVEIARIGAQFGAHCVAEPAESGLNTAVTTGYQFATQQNATHVLILPSDLPFLQPPDVTTVCQFAAPKTMVIASDKVEDGTNALLLPAQLPFRFQYGRASYHKHLREAGRHNLDVQIVRRPNLQFDLDTVQDWTAYQQLQNNKSQPQFATMRRMT